jgi:hypothetical protein
MQLPDIPSALFTHDRMQRRSVANVQAPVVYRLLTEVDNMWQMTWSGDVTAKAEVSILGISSCQRARMPWHACGARVDSINIVFVLGNHV